MENESARETDNSPGAPGPGRQRHSGSDIPLCVDLDGTLVRSDLFLESLLQLARIDTLSLILLPIWLTKGKAYVKSQIARRVSLNVGSLPYHKAFLEYLRGQRASGRTLILATGSNEKFANQVADHLQIFDTVIASDEQTNVTGARKLEKLSAEFGENGFDYSGNSQADLRVWLHARYAVVVDPERGVESAVRDLGNFQKKFEERKNSVSDYLRAMRVHQWIKNLLVFVPLIASHQPGSTGLLLGMTLAFLAFSLCTSSCYLLNDLLDLQADRQHPRKRSGPLASGAIDIKSGIIFCIALFIAAFAMAQLLPIWFSAVLGAYFGLAIAHSVWLKKLPIMSELILAGLYTMRVLAGATAVAMVPSARLLTLSMLVFLSLVIVMRNTDSHYP